MWTDLRNYRSPKTSFGFLGSADGYQEHTTPLGCSFCLRHPQPVGRAVGNCALELSAVDGGFTAHAPVALVAERVCDGLGSVSRTNGFLVVTIVDIAFGQSTTSGGCGAFLYAHRVVVRLFRNLMLVGEKKGLTDVTNNARQQDQVF